MKAVPLQLDTRWGYTAGYTVEFCIMVLYSAIQRYTGHVPCSAALQSIQHAYVACIIHYTAYTLYSSIHPPSETA